MNTVYFLLGGNIGRVNENLQKARIMLEKYVGRISKESSVYKTDPWGFEHESFFLNQLVVINTEKKPHEVMSEVLKIELLLGRKRDETKWKERTMDVDILFYNDEIIDSGNLKIPHPYLHKRRFALVPMNEVAAELVHPVFKKNISRLLKECPDKLNVSRCETIIE